MIVFRYTGAMISSIIMIGKVAAENWLFRLSENNLSGNTFIKKLRLVARFLPVFALTAVFRQGSGAVFISYNPFLIGPLHPIISLTLTGCYVVLAIVVLLPLLLSMKWFNKDLRTLSLIELVHGIIGEGTTIAVWGNLGRQGSRNIQLIFAVYHLIYNVLYLVWVINDIATTSITGFSLWEALGFNNILLTFSCLTICSGLFSFILLIYQIYYFIE